MFPPLSKTSAHPALENYRQLLADDFRVVQTNILTSQDSESHVLHKGEKTWKTFQGSNAEESLYRQPQVRQLFGFTQSRDFLGLVFHERQQMASLLYANDIITISRFAASSCVMDTLDSLLTSVSSFQGLVDPSNFNSVRQDESGPMIQFDSSLSPQADRSGKLHVVLSAHDQNRRPAPRYALHSSSLESYRGWIQNFSNASFPLRDAAFVHDSSRFYGLVDATAYFDPHLYPFSTASLPQFLFRILCSIKTAAAGPRSPLGASAHLRWIIRHMLVSHIQLPSPSAPVLWNWYPTPFIIRPSQNPRAFNQSRIVAPPEVQTALLHGYCDVLLDEPVHVFAFRHIPVFWKYAQQLYYFSADPDGHSRLSELDLSRSGVIIKRATAYQTHSKTLGDFALKAVMEPLTKGTRPLPPALEHPQARSSSVDRYMIYPSTRAWDRSHIHSVLCDLVTEDECVCSEAENLLFAEGHRSSRTRYDPDLHRERCPCYDIDSPAQRKRPRAKSVDRASRVVSSISPWISLMAITGMSPWTLRDWYLEPFLNYPYFDNFSGPNRSSISPWTLMHPLEEERGRNRKSKGERQ
ncbi:hypothetical protein DL96DRAFT_1581869, partial [Flagelloscypha sp. PMI_526]